MGKEVSNEVPGSTLSGLEHGSPTGGREVANFGPAQESQGAELTESMGADTPPTAPPGKMSDIGGIIAQFFGPSTDAEMLVKILDDEAIGTVALFNQIFTSFSENMLREWVRVQAEGLAPFCYYDTTPVEDSIVILRNMSGARLMRYKTGRVDQGALPPRESDMSGMSYPHLLSTAMLANSASGVAVREQAVARGVAMLSNPAGGPLP